MTKAALEYAEKLKKLNVRKEFIKQMKEVLEAVPQIRADFTNPTVSLEKKHNVIDKVFPSEIRDFLKTLCSNNDIALIDDIFEAYEQQEPEREGVCKATLLYVTFPTDEQLEGIKAYLKREYKKKEVELTLTEDKSLIGGFVIHVGNEVLDWSNKEILRQLERSLKKVNLDKQASTSDIISILKSEIEEFEKEAENKEVGYVSWVGDGIVSIDGINHAMYGEIVMFDNGEKGMVQDIRRNDIGCILFGKDDEIMEGTRVVRTGKRAGIPVGDAFLGRVVNALGEPIDGKGEIPATDYRPVESEAPGIVDRKSVDTPMETGILSIDSMFPIGRGQRELIIGDRQTGKTSIATDTMINQKGKDVICIYVAIGQKASTVAKVVSTLREHDAMDYSIVLASTASDSSSLQYIAPYAGTALAEYFMHEGKDVLIVYDDLSKHAVAYRAISLLLERSPGREAYPGDVFYLHSRLLERSSHLSSALGGGSITALPIVETQAGDVSAYIPTNVISITDGQIFLESNLFFSGMRPAVNVGLSVSRVGGAAQTKAMKKAAGSVRIDLAQYREMEVFTQFSSDLDDTTKEQLAYGKSLMELLKQPLNHPLSMPEQVITLVAATAKKMTDLPLTEVKKFQMSMLSFVEETHPEIVSELEEKKALSEELREKILKAVEEYKSIYQAGEQ